MRRSALGHHLILRPPEEAGMGFRANPCLAGACGERSPSRRATLATSSAARPRPLAPAARFRAGPVPPPVRCRAMPFLMLGEALVDLISEQAAEDPWGAV